MDDGAGLPFYVDSSGSYVTNEAGPDASVIFLTYMGASWTKTPVLQDTAEQEKEFQRATAKAAKPDPNLLVDFNTVAADSIWSGGGGGWSLKKSIVETAPGKAKAYRGEFKVGEWCTSVIPTGGNLSNFSGISCLVRGNDCRLRLAIDDANAEDWGKEIPCAAEWKPVTLFFTGTGAAALDVDKEKKPLDVGGIQKFKIQALNPAEGWYEIADIRKVSAPVPARKATGLLKLSEGDPDAVWSAGGGAYKVGKTIEAGPLLHVKFTLGQWCMVGVTGNYKAGNCNGFKFKAKSSASADTGQTVNLRVAVQDAKGHDFGKSITLSEDLTEYTVLFSDMERASWENQDKGAELDTSSFIQIKLQPSAPGTGDFWISEIEWVK